MAIVTRISPPDRPQKGAPGVVFRVHWADLVRA